MSHNEKRGHWVKEGAISLGTGVFFGMTNVIIGHPFDTIKTKMQAQKGFENMGMLRTFAQVFKNEGVKGLYRGCVPPLLGSSIYRSVQFSAFEATYTAFDNSFGKTQVPFTHGIEIRVLLGGLMAGNIRALVETPLEYAKIKRQTGSNWKLRDTFTGMKITWIRCQFLLPSFFIFLDSFRRHLDGVFRSPLVGPFLASGCASVMAWWIVWPLEMLKSQVQAGYMEEKNLSLIQRIKLIVRERGGFFALYRGLAPGTLRSFFGNGTAMVVMQYAQRKVTQWGLRD